MATSKAHDLLEDPEYAGKLNMEEFRRLLLRAGYSQEDSDEAAKQRGWDRLSAGEVM